MVCGGTAKLFYEYLSGGDSVYIFGGGHVGRALARQLGLLGYYTILVDDRKDIFPDPPEAKQCIHESFHAYAGRAPIDESSYVIVCTPSHANDYDVVRTLLNRGVRPCYLGLLASSAKKPILSPALKKSMEGMWTSPIFTVRWGWTSEGLLPKRSPCPLPQR